MTDETVREEEVSESVIVDVSAWRMRDHEDWIRQVHEEKNVSGMIDMMAEIVLSWPFDGDPSDPEAYRDLTSQEWVTVTAAVGEAISAAFQRPGDRVDQRRQVRKNGHRKR
jgi:hypothetical protein